MTRVADVTLTGALVTAQPCASLKSQRAVDSAAAVVLRGSVKRVPVTVTSAPSEGTAETAETMDSSAAKLMNAIGGEERRRKKEREREYIAEHVN